MGPSKTARVGSGGGGWGLGGGAGVLRGFGGYLGIGIGRDREGGE